MYVPQALTLGFAALAAAQQPIAVGVHPRSVPVLEAFTSYSIEFAFFPDFAGNKSHPNTFSDNLLNSLGKYLGTKPYIRVGGNTQDYALYDATLPTATKGSIDPARSTDYPTTLSFGPSFFESYSTWPSTRFSHGYNMGKNGTAARRALLDSVKPACEALRNKHFAWEFGNEPDLFKTSAQGPVRPPTWSEKDYVTEWLNATRQIRAAMEQYCLNQTAPSTYKYLAPSFAGTSNSLDPLRTWQAGLDSDIDISLVSTHNYISGADVPGVTLQGTLMNHSSTVDSVAKQVNESQVLQRAGLINGIPFTLGETNSLYNQGRPGLSNTFGAALWGFDFNMYCASQNISRVHMHQGTDYRYAAWQPLTTRATPIGTKPPFYGQIAAAAALGPAGARVEHLPQRDPFDAAYAVYAPAGALARLAAVNLRAYNYSANLPRDLPPRPQQNYTFALPPACAGAGRARVSRLVANGSDAVSGVAFDGLSFNYELAQGRPVVLRNVTRGEMVPIVRGGLVSVVVPDSSAVVLALECAAA